LELVAELSLRLTDKSKNASRPWCGIIPLGGPWGTVPELLFEKKQLIPDLQQMLISQSLY
jgi:hypothetical protein